MCHYKARLAQVICIFEPTLDIQLVGDGLVFHRVILNLITNALDAYEKSNIAFEKGGQVLGEWRLSSIENGSAVFSHPEGKFLVLNAFSNE
jgi:phosphoglycerate-specific signal transduction histidine kinase